MENIFKNIDNSADLKTVLLQAKECGFDFGHEYNVEKKLLENIVTTENNLGLDVTTEKLTKEFFQGSYSEFRKSVKKYFSNFGVDDKIKELLKDIYTADTKVKNSDTPKQYEKLMSKGYIDLGKGKRERELYWFMWYDFTKPTLKLSVNDRNRWEFNKLISLLGFEFEIPYYSEFTAPNVWETDDFKIYKNHTLEIKNIKLVEKLKPLLIEKYETANYHNMLIKK